MSDLESTTEITHGFAAHSDSELLEQCQSNFLGHILASAKYLSAQGVDLRAWSHGIADTFVLAWDQDREWDAGSLLDALLTNFRALGADVTDATLAEREATATIAGYPDVELCAWLDVDPALADVTFEVGAALVARLGASLIWQHQDDAVRLTVRTGADAPATP